jgi:hypothetical protein
VKLNASPHKARAEVFGRHFNTGQSAHFGNKAQSKMWSEEDSISSPAQTTLYLPGALESLSAAAMVPSLSSLMSSLIASWTTTSVSPSTKI